MKKASQKLVLHRETIRALGTVGLKYAVGGADPVASQSGDKQCIAAAVESGHKQCTGVVAAAAAATYA